MNRKQTLLLIAGLLIALILVFLFLGCSCKKVSYENFESGDAEEFDGAELSQRELELFNDIKENKLSTEEITELVKGGVINEQLVEKFLQRIDQNLDDVSEQLTSGPSEAAETAETFVGGQGQYACADFKI